MTKLELYIYNEVIKHPEIIHVQLFKKLYRILKLQQRKEKITKLNFE